MAAKAAVTAAVTAAASGDRTNAAKAPLAAAALACRKGKLRSAWPLMAMGRAFAHMDLRVLVGIANHRLCRTEDDAGNLTAPTRKQAEAELETEAGWAALEERDRKVRVLARFEVLMGKFSRKVFDRLFKPGRAVKVPQGARLAEVATDAITGTAPVRFSSPRPCTLC